MMAKNDIVFTSEIKLDVEQAKKDLKGLSAQINDIFDKTGKMMSAALGRKNFGFSNYVGNYAAGIESTEELIDKLKGKANTKQSRGYINKAGSELRRLKGLTTYMAYLSKYDKLYSDITRLQNVTFNDKVDPQKGLGRYGTLQRYANRLLGLMYRGNLAFPDVFSQKRLERAEYFRDINRKSGSGNRSALRYILDRKYSAASLSRAGDYMLMTGEGDLGLLSSIYGLGLGTDATAIPKRVSAKARNDLGLWSSLGLSAYGHKQALLGGGLTPEEHAYHLYGYKEDMKAFINLQKKLFPEEKAIAENLKKLNKSDLVAFGSAPGRSGPGFLQAIGGMALIGRALNAGEHMLESYWGESITRSVYGSKQAYATRWKEGGALAGSVGGAALGAAIGSMGGWNLVGAAIGGIIGSFVGPLYGIYKGKKNEADIKSATEMMDRIRNQALYGKAYNSYFAKAMSDVTGGNGMAELADKAMSLRARMMLGQVGEYDMLYYSMMPNYFAAKMNGMTGPQLAKIYKKDLMGIGDPSMRYVVGQAIGGPNAFAMANNKYFDSIYAGIVGRAGQYETAARKMETGYISAKSQVAMKDIAYNFSALQETARRGDSDFFIPAGATDDASRRWRNAFLKAGEIPIGTRSGENITFINVIQLDGTEIKKDIKTADEIYTDSWSQYAGG